MPTPALSPARLLGRSARFAVAVAALTFGGREARGHGAFHERIQELAAAIERDGRDAGVYFDLATVFCPHGDWRFALAHADSADELQPGRYPTDLLRGKALLGAGRPEAAQHALDRFLPAHRNHAGAWILCARAVTATRGPAAALADFRIAARASEQRNPDQAREAAAALAAAGDCDGAIADFVTRTRAARPGIEP